MQIDNAFIAMANQSCESNSTRNKARNVPLSTLPKRSLIKMYFVCMMLFQEWGLGVHKQRSVGIRFSRVTETSEHVWSCGTVRGQNFTVLLADRSVGGVGLGCRCTGIIHVRISTVDVWLIVRSLIYEIFCTLIFMYRYSNRK
jgi:hypothetical protein